MKDRKTLPLDSETALLNNPAGVRIVQWITKDKEWGGNKDAEFAGWCKAIDDLCRKAAGKSFLDLAKSYNWRGAYEKGLTTEQALAAAITRLVV